MSVCLEAPLNLLFRVSFNYVFREGKRGGMGREGKGKGVGKEGEDERFYFHLEAPILFVILSFIIYYIFYLVLFPIVLIYSVS